MQNRFLEMNRYLADCQRQRTGGGARPRPSAASRAASRQGWPQRRFGLAGSMSAAQRALVVLIENGGIDLGVGRLVEALLDNVTGSSLIPQSTKDELARAIDQKIREVTDNALENIELGVNRYAASKPDSYGDVIILRNGTALYSELRDTLVRLSGENKVVDLFVLTHGSDNWIALSGGAGIGPTEIAGIKAANGNRPVRLRAVYMMNCVGSTLNRPWLDAGAKASTGSVRNNYLPEPTMFFFFRNWKEGQSFNDAVTNAYRSTIDTLKTLIRTAVGSLPGLGPVAGLIAERLADVENRDFVLDSAPRIDGDGTLTIGSDALSFSTSVPSTAFTIVPVAPSPRFGRSSSSSGRSFSNRSRALDVIPRTQTWTVSQAGVDFIKSYEKFEPNLYNDPAGHCTVGYGTLVHRGNCNGDPSEAPYLAGMTEARATELLMQRLDEFQRVVNDAVTTELNQGQYDALLSFVYNVGAANFRGSTLLRKLNAGDYAAVPGELRKWVKANGTEMPGLVRRRNAEADMFASGTYSNNKSLYGRWGPGSGTGYGSGSGGYGRSFSGPARGVRNNNPGNIRISNEAWQGKVPRESNTDGAFEQFTSYDYGVRALVLLLRNYLRGGRNTVRAVIAAYAPPEDNNQTDAYVRFMIGRLNAGGLNVTADSPLPVNRTTLRLLAQGIGRMENGEECITDAQFDAGFALLSDDVRNSIAQSFSRPRGLYFGFGEPAPSGTSGAAGADQDTDEGEREDSAPPAAQLSVSVPAFCPLSEADDARTDHFRLSEFHSHDGVEVPRQVRGNVQAVMDQLEVLRGEVGAAITIVSGYRSPEHNTAVGGKPRSQHLCGRAADIKVDGMTPSQVHAKIEELIGAGRMTQGGLGLYRTFVHYDVRGTRTRW
jgi:GH24 family phage-related lysozyme (muramidase)